MALSTQQNASEGRFTKARAVKATLMSEGGLWVG